MMMIRGYYGFTREQVYVFAAQKPLSPAGSKEHPDGLMI